VASESEMAPKKSEIEGKKKEAQPSTAEWTHSKCSVTVHVLAMLGIYFVSGKYVLGSVKLMCVHVKLLKI
jgi:hypothetical protein